MVKSALNCTKIGAGGLKGWQKATRPKFTHGVDP
jgi:hypothetical protein